MHVSVMRPIKLIEYSLLPCIQLRRGDGVVFDAGNPSGKEEAGAIYGLFDSKGRNLDGAVHSRRVEIRFGRGQVNLQNVNVGDLVWRTKSITLEKQLKKRMNSILRPSGSDAVLHRKGSHDNESDTGVTKNGARIPVDIEVSGQLGSPLTVGIVDSEGRQGVGSAGMHD